MADYDHEDNEEEYEDIEEDEYPEEYPELDLYKVLGIDSHATQEQIQEAFEKLSKEPINLESEEEKDNKLQEIAEAYEILSDPEKREIYDKIGMKGIREIESPEMDLFSHLMGGNPNKKHKTKQQLKPTIKEFKITLEQAYKGDKIIFENKKFIICDKCEGKGGLNVIHCKECKGHGFVNRMMQIGPGMVQQMTAPCELCQGQGEIIDPANICEKCKGEKRVENISSLDVLIESGIPEGHQLYFKKEGDEYPNCETGDLYLHILIEKHEQFSRKGADLFLDKEINLIEALSGFEFDLKHLNGSIITISTIKDDIIHHHQNKKVKNLGMPFFKNHTSFGDLIIKFKVLFPHKNELSPSQIHEIQKILSNIENFEMPLPIPSSEYINLEDFEETETNPNPEGGKMPEEEQEYEDMKYGKNVQCGTQ